MATEGFSLLIGAVDGVLSSYTSFADIELIDELYDLGVANVMLTGLNGNAAPAQGMVLKIVFAHTLPNEQIHWEGIIADTPKKEQGNLYAIRAFTAEYLLFRAQTGSYRNYLSKSPHTIIQAAGTPNPLLINDQASAVMTYGSAAGVPNKVDGANPGTVLDQFVADSTTLFVNMRRLCMQARYDGSSYGLEWKVTFEGANSSSPRFYLVKRRERSSGYTPEVFNIPSNFVNARQGTDQLPGVDAVRVIGAGDGTSRISSGLIGTGSREFISEDKAIFNTTNATNMANRIKEIYGTATPIITANCYRHRSPTRAGDTITVTRTGAANLTLRVILRHYSLQTKQWTFVVGRPTPIGRDNQMAALRMLQTDTTTPQFTDPRAIVGDEPVSITPTGAQAVTTTVGVFGAWVNLATFTPSVDFLADYIHATISSYNDSSVNHDYDIEARLIQITGGTQKGTTGKGVAIAGTPQDALDTITYYTPVVVPLNVTLLSTQAYGLEVRVKGRTNGFTDNFVGQGVVFIQHVHNKL